PPGNADLPINASRRLACPGRSLKPLTRMIHEAQAMKRKARPESARECTEVHDQADYRGATPRFALAGERIGRKRRAWSVAYIKRRKSLSFPILIAFRTLR